jgi:hypothetical protein
MVLLFTSCASLTPERMALILDLVGSAAQVGLRIWLESHPDQRGLAESVVAELAGLGARGTPPTEAEVSTVLAKLPPDALRGTAAEVYLSGKHIVAWDNRRMESHSVDAKAAPAVARSVRSGMMAGMTPLPPQPVKAKREPQVVYVLTNAMPAGASVVIPVPSTNAIPPGKFAARGARVGVYRVERLENGTNWSEVSSFTSGVGEFRVKRVR